jgi:hypothetical protein
VLHPLSIFTIPVIFSTQYTECDCDSSEDYQRCDNVENIFHKEMPE